MDNYRDTPASARFSDQAALVSHSTVPLNEYTHNVHVTGNWYHHMPMYIKVAENAIHALAEDPARDTSRGNIYSNTTRSVKEVMENRRVAIVLDCKLSVRIQQLIIPLLLREKYKRQDKKK